MLQGRPRDFIRDCILRSGVQAPARFCCSRAAPGRLYAGTRPPKNGISAWLSVCGRLDVKIISAPA